MRARLIRLLVLALGLAGCNCRSGPAGLVSQEGVGGANDLDFGNVPVGQSETLQLVVKNLGDGPLDVLGAQLSGPDAADFQVQGTLAGTVAPGASVAAPVQFQPSLAGTRTASLTVETDGSPVDVSLTGVGIDVQLCVTPTPLDFGSVLVGASQTLSIALQNCGGSPADLSFSAVTGAQAADFSATGTAATTLQPGATLSVPVTFTPQSPGAAQAQLPVSDCAGCAPVPIDLQGTGAAAAQTPPVADAGSSGGSICSLSLSPTSLNFGNVAPNAPTTEQVTLTDQGSAACDLSAIALDPSSDPFFSIPQSQALSLTVQPAASATISVTFDPTSESPPALRKGTLTFQSNDPAVPTATVPLAGYINANCAAGTQVFFVLDADGMLSAFDPPSLTFTDIGTVSCPGAGSVFGITIPDTYFSMAVDENLNAWVQDVDGDLFQVSTKDASCQQTSFQTDQQGFQNFGMGFAFNQNAGADVLYIGGGQNLSQGGQAMFGSISFPGLAVSEIGSLAGWPELAGTADGQLWAYEPAVSTPSATVSQIDEATGAALQSYSLPQIPGGGSGDFAVGFWGGALWIFDSSGEASTYVYSVQRSNGAFAVALQDTGRNIVGAGVSTCAPLQ